MNTRDAIAGKFDQLWNERRISPDIVAIEMLILLRERGWTPPKEETMLEKLEGIATCALCGKKKELTNSIRVSGIQQPRYCKECLKRLIHDPSLKEEDRYNEVYWVIQMVELGDRESLSLLRKIARRDDRKGTAKKSNMGRSRSGRK